MHPSPRFQMSDREEMAAVVRGAGFGPLVVQTDAGLRAVHVPVLLEGGRLRFHISRGNAVYPTLCAGAEALFIADGAHAYLSPDWYGLDDRVPTWSYVAVELNGRVAPLGEAALLALLDDLSDRHEARLAPKPAWRRETMSPGRYQGLVRAIGGFEMEIREWRGTRKVDQDKPAEVRGRIAAALLEQGETAMAALYSSPDAAGGERR